MKEVLQQLANLQYIDSRIDELKQLRGDLPEDILDTETDIARLEAKQAKLEQEDKDLSVELNQLELDITSSTEKATKYEEQQLSVRNNREYDALTKEIEVQKQVVEKAHLRIEEAQKRKELVAPEKAIVDEKLDDVRASLEEMKANLDSVMSSTQEEEDQLIVKREEIVKNIDQRYLRNYNRLRDGLNNGIAVVAMDRGAAFGMSLPPQTQVEVRRMNKIIFDENSGRIVVDKAFFDKAKEQLSF
jgi:predicted  nucleic acid-binding Zn-ribbon protein